MRMKGSRRALKAWGSGQVTADVFETGTEPSASYAATVVLERAKHLDDVIATGLAGDESRVFVPSVHDSGPNPMVMGYEGSLSDPGGEVQVGASFFLQTQDYGTSEYLSLIGATLVRVVDDTDLQAFLDDADTARERGAFPEFLTHHLVRLCDVPGLGGPAADDGPALRIFVDADGGISTSPSGTRLGAVGDSFEILAKEWRHRNDSSALPCSVCLGANLGEETRVNALRERPWLARYHDAIAGIQHLRGREIGLDNEIRVSGFGGRLVPELESVESPADERPGAPSLLWTAEAAFVHSPLTDRVFQLDKVAGAIAERLLVHGSVESAAGDGVRAADVAQIRDFFAHTDVALCG